nr:extensin-like [Aedes albopictus]
MDYRQLTLALFFICSAVALEISNHNGLEDPESDVDVTNTARPLFDDHNLPKLRRQKRHEIEIHRVIKRRPKLPPLPPRSRKPRPPRRPPKPKVKYGPPNVNYPPITHYNPQSFDETFSTSYETSYSDHNSFAEPPVSYGGPIQPSPAFGSPPFAYGQGSTSYQGSTFGRPSFESTSFEGFGKPSLGSSNLDAFDPSKFPGLIDRPSQGYSSSKYGGHSSQPSFTNSKPPSFHSSTSFFGDGPSFNSDKDLVSHTRLTEVEAPKHQFPLEGFKQNPFRTPLTSYEVPLSHTKSNLFEPTKDYDTSSYKKIPNTYSTSSISSTHSSSTSSTDDDDDEYYPSLPNRYEQDQFHTPSKPNPNKPLGSTVQTINDNDPFSTLSSFYDGVSESQKVSVKTKNKHIEPTEDSFSLEDLYSPTPSSIKRNKHRRKKKPNPISAPTTHNLDTDDLRDAYGSSSDFHQVAIDADEFLEFEPQKQMKHSKPVGVTKTRDEDKGPANFVLLSSQNENKNAGYRKATNNPSYSRKTPAQLFSEYKPIDLDLLKSVEASRKPAAAEKPTGLEDINILSVQKSNSKSYYAGSNGKEPLLYTGFLPTRRNGAYYRVSNLDYETLDRDDEGYDDIADVGTYGGRIRNSRVKKDLTFT